MLIGMFDFWAYIRDCVRYLIASSSYNSNISCRDTSNSKDNSRGAIKGGQQQQGHRQCIFVEIYEQICNKCMEFTGNIFKVTFLRNENKKFSCLQWYVRCFLWISTENFIYRAVYSVQCSRGCEKVIFFKQNSRSFSAGHLPHPGIGLPEKEFKQGNKHAHLFAPSELSET